MREDGRVTGRHQLNGQESEQTPGNSVGQGGLVCCCPWGHRVGPDLATEQQHRGGERTRYLLKKDQSVLF